MPSLGEIFGDVSGAAKIFEVSGVSIGVAVDVIVVGVGVLSGTGVTVGGEGVTAL